MNRRDALKVATGSGLAMALPASDLEDAEGLLSGKLKPHPHISGESKERQAAD